MLHQRHDHEAAAEGERADLERDPRERGEAAGRYGDGRKDRDERRKSERTAT